MKLDENQRLDRALEGARPLPAGNAERLDLLLHWLANPWAKWLVGQLDLRALTAINRVLSKGTNEKDAPLDIHGIVMREQEVGEVRAFLYIKDVLEETLQKLQDESTTQENTFNTP